MIPFNILYFHFMFDSCYLSFIPLFTERSDDKIWNCKPFNVNEHPDLILERNDYEKIITFRCAGGKRLIGNSFTRCRDDGVWSHVSLPRCRD